MKELSQAEYFEEMRSFTSKFGVSRREVLGKLRYFDHHGNGRIKVHHLINVLRYNYHNAYKENLLQLMQFELECLNPDSFIDYQEFVELFMGGVGMAKVESSRTKFEQIKEGKKHAFEDYEELLVRIS